MLSFSADVLEAAPPYAVLGADHGNMNRVETYHSGDARCLLSSTGPCARVTSSRSGLFTLTKDAGKTDVYTLGENAATGFLAQPSGTATFHVNNALVNVKIAAYRFGSASNDLGKTSPANSISVKNGQNIDMYFKNSGLKGNFLFSQGLFAIPTYYTFSGNYNGSSDSSMKGKAFDGSIYVSGNAPVFTFKDGAVANITDFKDNDIAKFDYNPSFNSYALNLDTKAQATINYFGMEIAAQGYISVKDHSNLKISKFQYNNGNLTIDVTNGSTLDMGEVKQALPNTDHWYSAWKEQAPLPTDPKKIINVDNSTLKGDFKLNTLQVTSNLSKNAPQTVGFTFNFSNNAKFEGKIENNITAATTGKNPAPAKGSIDITLKNTSITDLDYTAGPNAVAPTFEASSGSTLGFKNEFTQGPANFNITDSTLKDIGATDGDMHFNTKNATIGNINIHTDEQHSKGAKITGTFDSSNIGNITSPSNWQDNISITNTAHKQNLKIGNIDFGSGDKKDSVKLNIDVDNGASVGNISIPNGQLTAKFDGASVGNIKNSNSSTDANKASSLTFLNTAGQSIGKIGDATSKFNGNITGTFDFTPTTTTTSDGKKVTKSLSLGDITSSTTSKNDLSFVFGGKDAKGETIGKLTKPITISGGSKDSSYTFANLGNLSTDSSKHKNIGDVSGIKFGNDTDMSSFNLVGTSVELKNGEKLDKKTIQELLGTTSTPSNLTSANFAFGNAKLVSKPDGTTEIIENKDDNGKTIYSTLTQAGKTHKAGDGYVAGKSSDADIGSTSDGNFKINAEFNYTPGTFDASKGESAWTGKLTGNVKDANFSFANAGTIASNQLGTESISDLKIDLKGTTLTGMLGGDVTTSGSKKPQNVDVTIDATSGNSKGLAIVGDGKHDVTLNFTGNDSKDKFTGAILGGDKDSSISIQNLDGIKINSTAGGSIVDGLKSAGVTGINNPDAAKNADGTTMTLTDDQKKDISTSTEFKLTGSSISGNIKDTNYSYNLGFNSTPTTDDKGNTTPAASFNGTSIDFSGNTNNQELSFSGKGAINPDTHQALNITLGTGDTKLNFDNTGATVAALHTENAGTNSSLSSNGTSVIGDWNKGSTDVSFNSDSKFYGTLGGAGDKPIHVSLGQDSLYSPTDPVVQAAYQGTLKTTDSSGKNVYGTPVVDLSSSGDKELNFNNPGQELEIKGLTSANGLDKGDLVANNMSLKGDLYSHLSDDDKKISNVKANLSFDSLSTDDKPDTSFTTDHIGVLADGSSLSFNGEGSLKPLTPYDSNTKKGGITTISLGGYDTGYTNFNLNNTGATVVFSQVQGQKDVKGDFNIRGTNIILENGLSAWEGAKVNLVFANASKATQDTELKTKEGTLLTSKTDSSAQIKPSADYVDSSTLTLKQGTVSLKGQHNMMTFIGDSSIMATPVVTKPMELSSNAKAEINLVNMGVAIATPLKALIEASGAKIDTIATALASAQVTKQGITDTTQKTTAIAAAKTAIEAKLTKSTMADLLMQNNNAGGTGGVTYTYNLIGTTLGNANIQAPASSDGNNQTKVIINASFDNRDLAKRDNDTQKYYSNKDAIGSSLLEIGKSTLNGDLNLDAGVSAHFSFYGNDSQASGSKITGGAADSTFYYQDTSMNFGAGAGYSNLQMNGKIILNGVSATGSYNPTGNVNVVSLSSDGKKEINALVFKKYADNQSSSTFDYNLQSNGDLMGVLANLNDVLALKNTSFIGSIDSAKATNFVFAGKDSSAFGESDSSKATKLGTGSANIRLDLIDVGTIAASNINAGTGKTNTDGTKDSSSFNEINLYGQSALATTTTKVDGTDKQVLSIGGGDSVKLTANIDKTNAALWGANDKGELSFDVEGTSAVNSIYNLTFNGGIAYPNTNASFYTGNIGLLNNDSVINFIDAGNLKDTQFENTKANVNIIRTTITGDIYFNSGLLDFKNGNSAFAGNVIYKDPSDNVKNLYFDFTGNNKADKIVNDKANDSSFYLSGGAGSRFTFINLVDNHVSSSSSPVRWVATNKQDSVFNTLGSAGVHFRAANGTDKKKIQGKDVSQSLDTNTTFSFVGTSITGDIATNYGLDLVFYNLSDGKKSISVDNNTQVTLSQSSYSGSKITANGGSGLSVAAFGRGALGNNVVTLSSNKALNITASSYNGEVGSISTTNVQAGSSMVADHLGFSGDFITAKDTNGKGGNIDVSFMNDEIKDGFILGSKDADVKISLSNTALADNKENKIIIGSGISTLSFKDANKVHLFSSKDANGTSTFDKDSKGTSFADGSSIVSVGTSIVGDIYTNNFKDAYNVDSSTYKPLANSGTHYDLAFNALAKDGVPSSFYAGSYIGYGSSYDSLDGYSKLSFDGRGSLKSIITDKDGNVSISDAKNATDGKNLKAADVSLTIATHSILSKNDYSTSGSISLNNTGGVVTFGQNKASNESARTNLMNAYSISLKGVSLYGDSFYGGVYSPSGKNGDVKNQSYSFIFANGNNLSTNQSKDLTDNALGDNYIEQSSYGIKDYENTQDKSYIAPSFTFIGSSSHNFYSDGANKATKFVSANEGTMINFVNADTSSSLIDLSAFNQSATDTSKDTSFTNTGTMNLVGTSLGTTDLSKTNLNLNAEFNNNGTNSIYASNPDGSDLLTNAFGVLHSDMLKVQKSTLNGELKLGNSVKANLSFYGKDAFGASAKVTGGTSDSTLGLNGAKNLSYANLSGFGGVASVVNSSFSGDLKDSSTTTGSESGVLKAYFNDSSTALTSTQGKAFVSDYNHNASSTMQLDLSTPHTLDAQIGMTKGSLDLAFIGKGSTGEKFKIASDNSKNIYSFVDYGKIDLSNLAVTGSTIKGTIKWVGDSYQVGKVENSVDANIDLSATGDDIKDNTYVANGGKQDITFDFGGSVTNPDGSSKQIGQIQDGTSTTDSSGATITGGETANSTYTVAHLTNSQSSNPSESALSTNGSDIITVLNHTINPDGKDGKDPFTNTTGTIGISGTSIHGDLNQDKNFKGTDGKDTTFNGTVQATFDTTSGADNPSTLDGNVKGDATKDLTFKGEGSSQFNDDKTISGGDKDSKYNFQDNGTITTTGLNNILNQGTTTNNSDIPKQTTQGEFNFDGSTTIKGDIVDAANHEEAKNQTINIGKNPDKSPNGVVYQGDISTSSKVDANFGVGSNVNITNKNDGSVYDFSSFEGTDAPVVANIDMDSYKAGSVLGFSNGDTSLVGSIQDQNQTKNSYVFKGGNGKTAGHWILTKDSAVDKLTISNDMITQEALEAPTANNPLAIVDLRGTNSSSLGDTGVVSGAVSLLGAKVSRAADVDSNSYMPLNLSVNTLDANNAVFRMGVNLPAGVASKIQGELIGVMDKKTNKMDYSQNNNRVNYLQFYPEGGGSLSAPIVVANIVGTINTNYFKGVSSKAGLRIYTPEVVGKQLTENAGQAGGLNVTQSTTRTEFSLISLNSSVNAALTTPLEQTLSTAYRSFRVETNNLHLRMGELRGIGATQGAWARIMNGMGSDDTNTDYYTTIQAGYDYKFDVLGGVNYVGVVADTSIINSKGNDGYKGLGNTLGLGIYNTYLMDNGLYVDAITKYLYMHNRINSTTASEEILDNSAFLLGGEVGYRYKLDKAFPALTRSPYTQGYYIEPQVELIYGYISGNNFNTSLNSVSEASTISATLNGNNALISRVGAVFGKEFRTNSFYGDVRLGISYVNEMNTGGSTSLVDSINPEAISKTTPSNNKLNLSLGTNVKINDDWRVYADVSRTFFGIYNIDYNLNIGGRWSFGKKTSHLEENLRAKKQAEQISALKAQEAQRKQQQAQAAQTQQKETIKANKVLSIAEAKTTCQGCAPESGYYLRIVTISAKNANLEKLLQKHSYRVYSFKDSKNVTLHTYLAGPYKTQSEIDKNKNDIDKITQWANNNKSAHALVYEVQNSKK